MLSKRLIARYLKSQLYFSGVFAWMQLTPSPSCPAQTPLELCQFENLVKAIFGHHTIATLQLIS